MGKMNKFRIGEWVTVKMIHTGHTYMDKYIGELGVVTGLGTNTATVRMQFMKTSDSKWPIEFFNVELTCASLLKLELLNEI